MNSDFQNIVNKINLQQSKYEPISNDELRGNIAKIQQSITTSANKSRALEDSLVPVFAIVKETARRFAKGNVVVSANDNDIAISKQYDFVTIEGDKAIYHNKWVAGGNNFKWEMVHYDEQILGGILLHQGYAVEMATGEGKTLVATLPAFLNALTQDGVHIMTVNSYLSKRDFEMTRPLYMFHGLTVGCIEGSDEKSTERKNAYNSDITFGTNSSFVFDYLYDHLTTKPNECVQRGFNYCIVDELDSILIDDANTPHVIGGGLWLDESKDYVDNKSIFEEFLKAGSENSLYKVDKVKKQSEFTKKGEKWLADQISIPNLFLYKHKYEISGFNTLPKSEQMAYLKLLNLQNVFSQFLTAYLLYEKDVDYIVSPNGKILIVDQNTGRIREKSRWEHGLHTAIEVKENVNIQKDNKSLAEISQKNFYKLYSKCSGMSGTVMPVKEELKKIYGLKSITVPTHRPMIRKDEPLRIYRTEKAKDAAMLEYVKEIHEAGRPVLVGCKSVKRSDEICSLLDTISLKYRHLSAKTAEEEALIIAKAGQGSSITIATSMAGRGTDIKLSSKSKQNGGLAIIGTDMFDSIRVDLQLRGRAGRQGDNGSSIVFCSLEDKILNYLSKNEKKQLDALVSSTNDNDLSTEEIRFYFLLAQKHREEYYYRCRMESAKKDDMISIFRKTFYEERDRLLRDDSYPNLWIQKMLPDNTIISEISDKVSEMYPGVRAIVHRTMWNNKNREIIDLPFSDGKLLFVLNLNVGQIIRSIDGFAKEYKRKAILYVYDIHWREFLIYSMQNLDDREIGELKEKLHEIDKRIPQMVEHLLLNAHIPAGEKVLGEDNQSLQRVKPVPHHQFQELSANDNCPCGSGKKYCECHGGNIRKNERW